MTTRTIKPRKVSAQKAVIGLVATTATEVTKVVEQALPEIGETIVYGVKSAKSLSSTAYQNLREIELNAKIDRKAGIKLAEADARLDELEAAIDNINSLVERGCDAEVAKAHIATLNKEYMANELKLAGIEAK